MGKWRTERSLKGIQRRVCYVTKTVTESTFVPPDHFEHVYRGAGHGLEVGHMGPEERIDTQDQDSDHPEAPAQEGCLNWLR